MLTRILSHRSLFAATLLILLLHLSPSSCSLAQGAPLALAKGATPGRHADTGSETSHAGMAVQIPSSDQPSPTPSKPHEDEGDSRDGQVGSTQPVTYRVFLPAIMVSGPYYVATYGDDTNPGTRTQPWATLGHAASVARPGDVVIFQAGKYNAGDGDRFPVSGEADKPIVFKAEQPGAVYLKYSDARRYKWDFDGVRYVTLDGFVLDGGGADAAACVRLVNSDHVALRRIVVYNTRGHGIRIYGGNSYVTVDDCDINLGFRTRTARDGIQIWDGDGREPDEHIVVRGCEIHNVDHCGIVAANARDVVIEHNHIYGVMSHGITPMYGCEDMIIRYNELHGDSSWSRPENPEGMKVGIFVHQDGVRQIQIYGNTIYRTSSSGIYVKDQTNGPIEIYNNTLYDTCRADQYWDGGALHFYQVDASISVLNNIVHTAGSRALSVEAGCNASRLSVDYNLWFSSLESTNVRWLRTVYPSLTAYVAAHESAGIADVAPGFNDVDNADFSLERHSPIVDRGRDVGLPFKGAAPDLGAVESW